MNNRGGRGGRYQPSAAEREAIRINELKAEGKCYLCTERGHMARDCPRKQTAKPPAYKPPMKIGASSVQIQFVEKLAEEERRIRCHSVNLDISTRSIIGVESDMPDLVPEDEEHQPEEEEETLEARRIVERMAEERREKAKYRTSILDTLYDMSHSEELKDEAEWKLTRISRMSDDELKRKARRVWRGNYPVILIGDTEEDDEFKTARESQSESESGESLNSYQKAQLVSREARTVRARAESTRERRSDSGRRSDF